jgi:hypothetical protein
MLSFTYALPKNRSPSQLEFAVHYASHLTFGGFAQGFFFFPNFRPARADKVEDFFRLKACGAGNDNVARQ